MSGCIEVAIVALLLHATSPPIYQLHRHLSFQKTKLAIEATKAKQVEKKKKPAEKQKAIEAPKAKQVEKKKPAEQQKASTGPPPPTQKDHPKLTGDLEKIAQEMKSRMGK